jgi:hydrophobic/amphiphilic exporter-1 (mainly G- bacteria), HAE1 family
MSFIRYAIRYPITVAVGVILVAIFGTLALQAVPIQLTPNIDRPQVTVSTFWPGASPVEVERELVNGQEEQLKSVDGLVKMESDSRDNFGTIVLEFPVGSDVDSALIKVSNKLQQVRSYPTDSDRPVLTNVDTRSSAIAWFILSAKPGNDVDVATISDYVEDEVKPLLERVQGVAQINVLGGRKREMQVVVDPAKLAVRGLTVSDLARALSAENKDYSAGDFNEGKRRYVVRTVGDYRTPEDVEAVIVSISDGTPVFVRDVARVQLGYRKATAFVRQEGKPALAINALRESGSNVMEVMAGLRAAIERVDRALLEPQGLQLEQVYDETVYIDSAIELVRSNIVIGGALAVLVLLAFLRSLSGTLVVAVAIPISIVATFLVMFWLGRSLNVISLAGLAFAVGMVVDNSIVVLENIFRHRQMGKGRRQAALDGAIEVWGAVLASTLTTVAVFVPVIFVQEEAGQLFRDIAIATSASVLLSLLVSLTVIPTLAARILGGGTLDEDEEKPLGLMGRISDGVAGTGAWVNRSFVRRVAVILLFNALSFGGVYLLMPKAEYLPTGNRNLAIGILLPPPGYNLEELQRIAVDIEGPLRQYWEAEPGLAAAAQMPGGGLGNFFFVGQPQQAFMGMTANDETRVKDILPVLQGSLSRVPGSIGIALQTSLFQRGGGQGRSIDVDLRGPELGQLIGLGGRMFGEIRGALPGAQVRPVTSLDLGSPELRLTPDRRRMADVGLTNRELGFTVDALVDGAKVSDYRVGGREIDLVLKGDEGAFRHGHELESISINTPSGGMVTLGSVASIELVGGPVQISHQERQRAVRLAVVPPEDMPLQGAMDTLNEKVLDPLRESGALPPGTSVLLTGTADDLTRTRKALIGNFILALVITYLLMASLFQSWVYPFVILFSVPLAAVGGFIGLKLVNVFLTYQALDILTMLGFVILIGIVVNNSILIVHQALNLMRERNMTAQEAIPESVRTRVRPILMTTATSVFGMAPLVLFPGAGSELYRGLGSVVLGGLVVSTVFTLLLVPAVFSLTVEVLDVLGRLLHRLRHGKPAEETPPPPPAAGAEAEELVSAGESKPRLD